MENKAILEKFRIRKLDLFRVFIRSFFVQSVWNYRSLISIGFGTCLFPVLKRLYPDLKSRKAFLMRHLKFFNAHPYMVSYALGVSIRLEEEFANGEAEACHRLERLKDLLISILGAVGDQLFWFTIKPFSLILGALIVLLSDNTYEKIAALIVTFIVYNVPHLYLRYKGIIEGYQMGIEIYKCFKKERFERIRRIYLSVGSVAFILFIFMLGRMFVQENIQMGFYFVGAVFYTRLARKISRNFYHTCLVTLLFFIVIGLFLF